MARKPTGGASTLILAHVACCGGILLFSVFGTGILTGAGAWLFGGGWVLIGATAILAMAGTYLWRRPAGRLQRNGAGANLAARRGHVDVPQTQPRATARRAV